MADEVQDQEVANQSDGVTIKPSAIEPKPISADGVGPNAVHLPPYHNAETAKIAEDRKDDGKDKPYEFSANGYTVVERDAKDTDAPASLDPALIAALGSDFKHKMWDVTADGDFLMTFNTKNAAENYALTHAEAHKDLPATVSKA